MGNLNPSLHHSIHPVEDAEILLIKIIASEHLQDSSVSLYDLKFSDAGLIVDQCFVLERLDKVRDLRIAIVFENISSTDVALQQLVKEKHKAVGFGHYPIPCGHPS